MNTNVYKTIAAIFAIAFVMFAIPLIARADDGFYGGGFDEGFYGGGFDDGFYGSSFDDGFYGSGFDDGFYGSGYDDGFYGYGYDDGLYGSGFDDGFYGSGYDDGFYGYGYDDGFYGSSFDDGFYGESYSDIEDFYGSETTYSVVDEYGVEYSYQDYAYDYGYNNSYSQGCTSGCGGYSTPGCTSCGQSYTPPGCASCNPIRVTPPSYPPIVISTPPSKPSNNSTVVNTNTCTNNSCNTNVNNIDNSVNGSFNSYASAPVVPVYQTPPQYLAQYVFPQQPVIPGNYCTITASPSNIQNGQPSFLTWTSNPGVTSAWLSDGIGRVAPGGTLIVRPNVSTNYTLTVQGFGGTYTCNTFVNVSGTYVSLSQIPYTGFDFGAVGNAIYWLGLISFAAAGSYLALYYKGGASIFMGSILGGMKLAKSETKTQAYAPARIGHGYAGQIATPAMFARETHKAFAPVRSQSHSTIENLPVARTATVPKDSMNFVPAEAGKAPRIVVTRC